MGKFRSKMRHFMLGRYGSDKLNIAILIAAAILSVVAAFMRYVIWNMLLLSISYGLMGWAIFRMLSRNTYRRYEENRKYLMFLKKLKDKEHKYFSCPRCRQQVRVPRKKGKISITCPKCREKFIKKT